MENPYQKYVDSRLWKIIDVVLDDLQDNQDLIITTKKEYVVGYICKAVEMYILESKKGD